MEELEISKHAKERYAERIMGRDSQLSIAEFVLTHEEKIQTDIAKMIEFGKLIYSGKRPYDTNNKGVEDVYLNGTWIIILDHNKNIVITLYCIDLGLGKEFNDVYLGKMLEKLEKTKEEAEATIASVEGQRTTYKELIEENQVTITEYRKIANSLEEQNQMYKELIESLDVQVSLAQNEVRKVIGALIGKKVY